MGAKAKTYRAEPRTRVIRASKVGTAREAIGEITPGCNIFVFTYGQFSLIDALCELLRQAGPSHVTLSTWTAAEADLRRAESLLRSAEILSMRYIVDRSFLSRMPHYCRAMRELFGDDCIRTARSHAKWFTIRNDRWNLAVRTSMNMNHNPRLENLEISDDAGFRSFLDGVADKLFVEQSPGVFDGELPLLAGLATVDPERIERGEMGRVGLQRPATGSAHIA